MRTMTCAIVGLIIFVSQHDTVILVTSFPVHQTECEIHALPTGRTAGNAVAPCLDRLPVPSEPTGNILKLGEAMPVQLIGPRRGPVK